MIHSEQTSASNPLRIATLHAGSGSGAIGVTFAPGKQQDYALTGAHRRALGADLDAIATWNAAVVVTLVEQHELDTLGIANLGAEVRRRHMEWHHWPIQDYGTLGTAFAEAWPARSAALRSVLACGGRILIHCKGGLGRAGMIAARLLVETGTVPAKAITAVRAVRPGAVETEAQGRWVAAGKTMPLVPRDDRRGERGTVPSGRCLAWRSETLSGPQSSSSPNRASPSSRTWCPAAPTTCSAVNGPTTRRWPWHLPTA